jgi:hypothetical protein
VPRADELMSRTLIAAVVLGTVAAVAGCGRISKEVRLVSDPRATVRELWQEPKDIERRNLYYGAGGERLFPDSTTFEFVAQDASGWSPGLDVRSKDGVEWSVKLGSEAQTEVVVSRLLWAIGFHQPPTYYVEDWALTGAISGRQEPGRFRPSLPGKVVGDWSWYENPFVGTREFGGLIVANLIVNNWDWKTSNNKIYELDEPVNGVARWFVVRDVGASLGRTKYPTLLKWFRLRGFGQGTRNDLPGFEQQGFITGVDEDAHPKFDYRGIYRDVIDTVSLADVRWTCTLMNRLSDTQWNDAFRAGGYTPEETKRYVTKIKAKIAQGLQVSST